MIGFSEFDAAEPLGPGGTVIEASAGTGKTFTISALVTRLVAEEGVPLDEILVVTFTRAATAELRARVRGRLVRTLEALTGEPPPNPDEHLAVLLATPDRDRAVARLGAALTHFDRAQIFTIHGFASRLLGYLGLRARLSPELVPAEVEELLLRETASDLIVGRYATSATEPIKTSRVVDIARAVVGTPDAEIVPTPDQVAGEARARVELARELREELRRRMRRAGQVSYDDGLVEVRDALADLEVGAAARELLARRYTVALVDESQDTDPTQWQVIRSVFGDSRLVVIGDPKQSIYSFRGADVEAYLAALDVASARRTLDTNWRSDGPLLQAFDTMFAGADFGDARIAYRPVRPAPGHEAARLNGIGAPLVIRRFGDGLGLRIKKDGTFYLEDTRRMVAADVASETVRLLTSGVALDRPEGQIPLRPDHIAVLCRTRRQVDQVRCELTRRSVPSVAARAGGVFASAAAEEWRRFLHGVESPERFPLVRLAAGSLLIGHTPQQVASLAEEEVLELQRRLRNWQELLFGEGVPALLAAVDRGTGLSGRVLGLEDGERIMTDLTHIAEEMHAVWRRRRAGSLLGWLEAAMTEADTRDRDNVEEPESRQRRLETDSAAVQVQTVHAAKGLQWPVVLVPYAWDVPRFKSQLPVFHAEQGRPPRPRLIDVAGEGSPDFARHQEAALAEDAAEEGRLLYVALTRAQHHALAWWVENTSYTKNSKLNELLTAGPSPESLVAAAGGTLELPVLTTPPPVVDYRQEQRTEETLERARFDRGLDYYWRRASFSSLSPEHPLDATAETSEQPPRADEIPVDEEIEEEAGAAPVGESPLPMAELPRGARFGTLLHHVLEVVPFDAPDLAAAIRVALDAELAAAGWDFDPEVFVTAVVAALTTPLGPAASAPRLCELTPARTLDELTFELPVRTAAGTVSLADIGRILEEHLPTDDPYLPYAATLQSLGDVRFRGFLTGAIDLTAAIPFPEGERFVVIDYKSNALPLLGEVASPIDYGPGPLATAMIAGNYVLQATLYQVALHRYLQWRLAGYDPERHLGGAMYLFARGMAGAAAPVVDGERCGVVRWRPPPAMITALSELFAGGAS